MCGRFADISATEKVAKKLKLTTVKFSSIKPKHNIAPTQPVLVIKEDAQRSIDVMQWGLVPSWSKDPKNGARMINARSETLHEKPSFKGPFKNSRCLIPADGFYEWKKEGTGKQPYFIRKVNAEPFTFAGLWSHWNGPDGSELVTCTIITKEADDFMRPLHHRMPVIIEEEDYDSWLSRSVYKPEELRPFLDKSGLSEGWEAFAVSTRVNSPSYDDEQCHLPV